MHTLYSFVLDAKIKFLEPCKKLLFGDFDNTESSTISWLLEQLNQTSKNIELWPHESNATNKINLRTWRQLEPCLSSRSDSKSSEQRRRKNGQQRRCGKIWRKWGTSGFLDIQRNLDITLSLQTSVDRSPRSTTTWDDDKETIWLI